jgi:hypothetical protein
VSLPYVAGDFYEKATHAVTFTSGFLKLGVIMEIRATSHTKLRARDHCTSSTLIGGKGGAGPSSLHTMLEGPTEYVNSRWM